MSSSNNPPNKPVMKLKLTSRTQPPSDGPSAQSSAQSPAPATPGGSSGLKLSFKPKSAASTPIAETAPALPGPAAATAARPPPPSKSKRKYTKKDKASETGGSNAAGASKPPSKAASKAASKKRPREDNDDGATTSAKKSKPTLSLKTSGHRAPQRTQSISIKLKTSATPKTPTVQRIKVKHVGQPPPRPWGAGYDSEAEDAEADPVIEHQFIMRMQPSPDCEYLHKAIMERRVGLPPREGGADVHFRFFDREGRRACVTVQGHHYAASLVDLPCVVEGMKSWEKKSGWYKTADICQMLLVHTQVDTEEQARDVPLPREIDEKTWQYPHGLTPPMHYVRKRRFRKRVSTRTIEAVEEEVERLLAMDEKAEASGGSAMFDLIDPNRPERDEVSSQMGDDYAMAESMEQLLDAQDVGADGGEGFMDAEGEMDDDTMAALMEQELLAADEDQPITSVEAPDANAIDAAHAVAHHALGGDAMVGSPMAAESPGAGTPGASAEPETEQDDDDEEDDDDDDDDDIDEAVAAAQEQKAQLREEVVDLQREVDSARQQMERQTNPMLKKRLMDKYKSLREDLELKKSSLGDDDDD